MPTGVHTCLSKLCADLHYQRPRRQQDLPIAYIKRSQKDFQLFGTMALAQEETASADQGLPCKL